MLEQSLWVRHRQVQSVPLSLWAQQEMNNVTCRRSGSAFHYPFLEPLSFPMVSLCKGNVWEKEKVVSSIDIMGFGAWLISSSGKMVSKL